METSHRRVLAALLPAFALTFTGLSAQAQNYYTTNFSNVDTGSSTSGYTPAAYTSPNTPTDPIVGQNGWASNDGTVTATNTGGSTGTQLVGNSNFVGQVGTYFGSTFAAALGGVYRTTGGTAGAPDAVPSAANAPSGIISLYHPVNLTPAAGGFSLNTDLVVTAPNFSGRNQFLSQDTFSLTLGTATTNLLTVTFTPAAVNPTSNDTINVTTTPGGTVATGRGITLNSQYHLTVTVTNAATGAFTLALQGSEPNPVTVYTGLLGAVNAATLTQVGIQWNLADKSVANGGFQGAGENYIAIDNLGLAVPEPSTYALAAAGTIALAWTLRLRRKQA